jgi:hypothetical protein
VTRPVAYVRTLAACPLLAGAVALAVGHVVLTVVAEAVAGVHPETRQTTGEQQ